MNHYFATFPAGCFELIIKHLKSFMIEDLKILSHDDSSVMLESWLKVEQLIELRYFTNVYLLIEPDKKMPLRALNGEFFRLMMLKDGSPQQMPEQQRTTLTKQIEQQLQLKPHTHQARNDFYWIERANGDSFLTLRLARAKFKREEISKGELRPELAHILCLTAGIKPKDTVLDMFAGYGAVALEAARGFGCKQIIAVDMAELPRRHERPSIAWKKADARKLDFIEDNSINRVVTDPPWGEYDSRTDMLSLYNAFTKEIVRVLKPDGIAVVLTGYEKADKLFRNIPQLKTIGAWPVLVSGKKATIYKLQKLIK